MQEGRRLTRKQGRGRWKERERGEGAGEEGGVAGKEEVDTKAGKGEGIGKGDRAGNWGRGG